MQHANYATGQITDNKVFFSTDYRPVQQWCTPYICQGDSPRTAIHYMSENPPSPNMF